MRGETIVQVIDEMGGGTIAQVNDEMTGGMTDEMIDARTGEMEAGTDGTSEETTGLRAMTRAATTGIKVAGTVVPRHHPKSGTWKTGMVVTYLLIFKEKPREMRGGMEIDEMAIEGAESLTYVCRIREASPPKIQELLMHTLNGWLVLTQREHTSRTYVITIMSKIPKPRPPMKSKASHHHPHQP